MTDSIADFISSWKNPAKTNDFTITIPFKQLSQPLVIRAKGTQLPSSELSVLELPHRGRKLKVPGQRTFAEWTVTVMETADMSIRSTIESWIELLDGSATGVRDPKNITTAQVSVNAHEGGASYKSLEFVLFGLFPTSVSAIELNFEPQTAPLEYQVTFQYSYHTITSGTNPGQIRDIPNIPRGSGGSVIV